MNTITATVNGITVIGETDDNYIWEFYYHESDDTPAFTLRRITDEVGDIVYEYTWADYPKDIQYIGGSLFDEEHTMQEVVEFIMAVYPN